MIAKRLQLSVKRQFMVINIGLIAFGLALSSLTLFIWNKIDKSHADQKHAMVSLTKANRLKFFAMEKSDALKTLLIDSQNTSEIERKKKADVDLEKAYIEMEEIAKATPLEEPLATLKEYTSGQLKKLEDDILADITAKNVEDASFKFILEYFPARQKFEKMSDDFSELAQKLADDRSDTIKAEMNNVTKLVLSLQTLGIAIFLFSFWQVSRSLVKRLMSFADMLDGASHGIRNRSHQQVEHAKELTAEMVTAAASLRETSTAAEQINQTVEANSKLAEVSKELSDKGQQTLSQGIEAVEDMLKSIRNIHENNHEMTTELERSFVELEKIINIFKSIEAKTQTINEIVLQTRLLSFNASVEAARAGENGKGFAVVAEEVGNLAQMSRQAAAEIEQLLQSSSSQVESVVSEVRGRIEMISRSSGQKVELGTHSADRCREAFDSIREDFGKIAVQISDIHQRSREQAVGVGEISKSVRSVDEAIQKNTERAKITEEQTREIQGQALVLDGVVDEMNSLLLGSKNKAA